MVWGRIMAIYYVSKKESSKGQHEVHCIGCTYMPKDDARLYLGDYMSCKSAVRKAGDFYHEVAGCQHCCSLAFDERIT